MLQALAVCAPPLEAWPQVALAKKQKQRLEFFLSEVAFRFCLCVSESQTVDFEIHGDLRNLHFKKWADIGKVVSGNLETNEQILHSHILMVGWNWRGNPLKLPSSIQRVKTQCQGDSCSCPLKSVDFSDVIISWGQSQASLPTLSILFAPTICSPILHLQRPAWLPFHSPPTRSVLDVLVLIPHKTESLR